jgi:hypothetical protein
VREFSFREGRQVEKISTSPPVEIGSEFVAVPGG